MYKPLEDLAGDAKQGDGTIAFWNGKRKRGRPKKTWKKQVQEETEKIGLKKEDALRRDKWRDRERAIAEEIRENPAIFAKGTTPNKN